MKNALPMSHIMDIYAILREVKSLPMSPTPEQVGRLRAAASFQATLLRLRIDDIKSDVEVA